MLIVYILCSTFWNAFTHTTQQYILYTFCSWLELYIESIKFISNSLVLSSRGPLISHLSFLEILSHHRIKNKQTNKPTAFCISRVPVVDIDIASPPASASYVQPSGIHANYNRPSDHGPSAPLTDFRRKHKRDSKLALAPSLYHRIRVERYIFNWCLLVSIIYI